MQYKDELFSEIIEEESANVRAGATVVNFSLNSYLFTIGAGGIFGGGVTTNVVNYAFQSAVFTSTPLVNPPSPRSGGSSGYGGPV